MRVVLDAALYFLQLQEFVFLDCNGDSGNSEPRDSKRRRFKTVTNTQ